MFSASKLQFCVKIIHIFISKLFIYFFSKNSRSNKYHRAVAAVARDRRAASESSRQRLFRTTARWRKKHIFHKILTKSCSKSHNNLFPHDNFKLNLINLILGGSWKRWVKRGRGCAARRFAGTSFLRKDRPLSKQFTIQESRCTKPQQFWSIQLENH